MEAISHSMLSTLRARARGVRSKNPTRARIMGTPGAHGRARCARNEANEISEAQMSQIVKMSKKMFFISSYVHIIIVIENVCS